MLSKTDILANIGTRKNLKTDTIDVPAWGGTVNLRGLTAGERDDFEMSCLKSDGDGESKSDMRNIRAKLVARSVVDEAGNRLFDDTEADALAGEAADVIDPIFSKCQSLNGMSKKDVEALAKN